MSDLDLSDRMTSGEAAALLGMSRSTLYSLAAQGIVPGYRPPGSGRWIFIRSEIVGWVAKGRTPSTQELQDKADRILAGLGRMGR